MQYDKIRDMILQGYEKKKTKKNDNLFSLTQNLEKIKFAELSLVIHHFDNKQALENVVHGWYPIHYASFNPDSRVINTICELMIKHANNLDIGTQQTKKSVMIGSTALDCACSHKNINNAIVLCSYGAQGLSLQTWGFRFLKGAYYKRNEQLDKKKIVMPENQNFSFPYPDNLLTRGMLYQNLPAFLEFFDKYSFIDEIKEFKENTKALFEHFFSDKYQEKYTKIVKENPLYETLSVFENTAKKIQQKDVNIKNNYLDLFLIPFYMMIYSNNVQVINDKGFDITRTISTYCNSHQDNMNKFTLETDILFSRFTPEIAEDFYNSYLYFKEHYNPDEFKKSQSVSSFYEIFKTYFLYKKLDEQIEEKFSIIDESTSKMPTILKI
jgi:hypothetical protein